LVSIRSGKVWAKSKRGSRSRVRMAELQKEFEFRVLWGFVEARHDRRHPNINSAFNSDAVVESAKVHFRGEEPGVLLQVSHREFKEGVAGSVLIDSPERAEKLAEFVSARKGKTVEQIAADVLSSGLFNPVP
jgi:hypothetical protein